VLEVGQRIGSGAQASVYLAKDCRADYGNDAGCNDAMVVKVLNPHLECATALEELSVVQHEFTLLLRAGAHPNIIKFLGVFCCEDDNNMNTGTSTLPSWFSLSGLTPRWVLVSEYLQGGDLHAATMKQRFKEQRSLQVMADLLSALAHIHSHEIAHRDVKAENVLLTKHGRAVLTDFGLAAPTSDAEAMCKLCGTPGYAAPEVITRKQPGVKVDIFSAGATLYFILCGRLPFRGSSVNSVLHRTLKKEVSFDVHPEFSQVSAQCKNFMCQLLQKDSTQSSNCRASSIPDVGQQQ